MKITAEKARAIAYSYRLKVKDSPEFQQKLQSIYLKILDEANKGNTIITIMDVDPVFVNDIISHLSSADGGRYLVSTDADKLIINCESATDDDTGFFDDQEPPF